MKSVVSIVAAAALSISAADAALFQFKGDNGAYDTPTGNIAMDCGTVGGDICSDNDALGLTYSKDGIVFNVLALAGGQAATLIQDIMPFNSGLGVLSENDASQDQTQFDAAESLVFDFSATGAPVRLTNIEFNAGSDSDCSNPLGEGPCGDFELYIDNAFIATFTAIDLLTNVFMGSLFEFRPNTAGAGFVIGQFEVSADVAPIPVPGAIPLLLSGLAGLGFAARGKRKTA